MSRPQESRTDLVDVLVVGAGPVGATVALELARAGVACTVVDRAHGPSAHPKMDFLNARSMEHFAALGLEEQIRAEGVAADREFWFQWRRDLHTPALSDWRAPSVRTQIEAIASSQDGTMPARAYQRVLGSRLEALARDRARAEPLVDLREGVRVVGAELVASGDEEHVLVRAVDSGGGEVTWRARFVVACDGARSSVREALGIRMDEQGPAVTHTDVLFRSADPRLTRDGVPFLVILGTGMTLVSRDGKDIWTASYPHLQPADAEADPLDVVRRKAGGELQIDEVLVTAQWEGRLAVASRYRQDPVFLAGDAAHTFFPTGGHGANTGIGDAVNLAWKLAAVVDGYGADALLDSYESERRPVALFAREMCAHLLEVWRRFPALVAAQARDEQLAAFLDRERHQVSNLGVHFAADYRDSPVVCGSDDATSRPWGWHTIEPAMAAGSRLPHVPLEDGRSSHDLLGPAWTLLDVVAEGDTVPLPSTLLAAAHDRALPLVHVVIGEPAARTVYRHRYVLVRPDQHIAWTGSALPVDPGQVLDHVLGRRESLGVPLEQKKEHIS